MMKRRLKNCRIYDFSAMLRAGGSIGVLRTSVLFLGDTYPIPHEPPYCVAADC